MRHRDTYGYRQRFWEHWLAGGYWTEEGRLLDPGQERKAQKISGAFSHYCSSSTTLHELGCGVGRNLRYILEASPDLAVSGNDLSWDACSAEMHPTVKEKLDFHETDTLSFLRDAVANRLQVDCVLVSDHLIHIPPDVIDEVLGLIVSFARRYVLFHEGIRRSPQRTASYWYAHDYAALEDKMALVHGESGAGPLASEYELRVYKSREDPE